jgi:hypothetical protein
MSARVIVFFTAFLIGIFANGLRVALIGIYAIYNKGADLHGPAETLYVSFIFFFGMVVLVLFNQVIRKMGSIRSLTAEDKPTAPRSEKKISFIDPTQILPSHHHLTVLSHC